MSDLISRSEYKSKLVKALEVLNKEYREALLNEDNDLILAIKNQQSAYMIALRLLDNEPTAYDIDKVVEELEKASKDVSRGYLGKDNNKYHKHYKAVRLSKAIEIVKQSGVSDDVCKKIQMQAYNNAIDNCLKILYFHQNEYDGIQWAIREIEELKEMEGY